jgi:hypothetical protein
VRPRLIDVEAEQRPTFNTGRELVHQRTDTCPRCGASLVAVSIRQDTLLRGGGYGGTRRVDSQECPDCNFVRVVAVATERPPR